MLISNTYLGAIKGLGGLLSINMSAVARFDVSWRGFAIALITLLAIYVSGFAAMEAAYQSLGRSYLALGLLHFALSALCCWVWLRENGLERYFRPFFTVHTWRAVLVHLLFLGSIGAGLIYSETGSFPYELNAIVEPFLLMMALSFCATVFAAILFFRSAGWFFGDDISRATRLGISLHVVPTVTIWIVFFTPIFRTLISGTAG